MDLDKGIVRSGFDRLMYMVSGMRGPLEAPGKDHWYGALYYLYVAYIEFAMLWCWFTIGAVFVSPDASVEVRCFTGFPVGAITFSLIRMVDMLRKRLRYKRLMEGYLSLYGDSAELNEDVAYYAKIIKNIPRILFLFTALPMTTMALIPVVIGILGGPRVLPIFAVFPFDPAEYIFLFIACGFVQATSAYSTTLRALCYENTFNMFACRQLALIKHLSRELSRILSIAKVNAAGSLTFRNEQGGLISADNAKITIIKELKQWVKNHQQAIRLAKDLQDMYSIALCLQYAFTGVLLCANAFIVVNVGGIYNILFCGLYVIGLLVELLITCRIGDLILYESNSVERMVEGTLVWALPADVYKSWLRIILTRAQVPTRISALGVFPLDMETYKSFVVTTYSFYTLLKEMKH